MDANTWSLTTLDIYNTGEEELAACHVFTNRMRAEQQPEDPPVPFNEFVARMRNIPNSINPCFAVVRTPDGEIVGQAGAFTPPGKENPHLIEVSIEVLPEHRRRGIGKQLLRFVAGEAQRRSRSLILSQTVSTAPAGEAFAEHIGARRGMEAHTNQLMVADVNWGLMHRWLEQGAAQAQDFDLFFLEGPIPEEILDPLLVLFNDVINDAPRDDLDIEDQRWTSEQVREMEQMIFGAGGQHWTAYVQERTSGDFAGLTEVFWYPNRPHIAHQGWTGVTPRLRGRKLARWLKAAMLERLMSAHPEIQFIRTGNANSNAPMQRINEEMGFRPYRAEIFWQVSTEQVLSYLER